MNSFSNNNLYSDQISRDVYSRAMSGVSVAKKNGGQTSAIFANDTRWRPNSQILHRRDRSNSRVTETARPSGVLLRSSMGSIFDNNPCFGTSNCRLYQCSEMHVEQTQHMQTSTCRQLTAGPAQATVLLKPYRRWECIHRHLMV